MSINQQKEEDKTMPNWTWNFETLEDTALSWENPEDDYAARIRDYADETGDYDLDRFSIGGISL